MPTVSKKSRSTPKKPRIVGIDLFCGAGGLTRGLEEAEIEVALGVDLDPACQFPFEANNKARFLLKSVGDLTAVDLNERWENAEVKVLAGCAPCQPFSTYSQGKADETDGRWHLLEQFERLALETLPHVITMENVPRLAEQEIFESFVDSLESEGYKVSHQVVCCADYGVPQRRNRLVLLASRLGPISLIPKTVKTHKTVKRALSRLPKLGAGERCEEDPLHMASGLSDLNMRRMRASKPGGTWRDWPEELVADCHKKETGKTYPGVYGRMEWAEPSPTITTQFFGFGNGRFGHPEQDRAISLREGAILQSFPRGYRFVKSGEPISLTNVGRLIGNAVPVKLGEAIGRSIVAHVASHYPSSTKKPNHSKARRLAAR